MTSELETLLDQVRDALVNGDLKDLDGLTDQIESLAASLSGLDRPAAERLQRKADRNARLLLAASRGVKAARQRLAEIVNSAHLSTYTANGRRETLTTPPVHPPKRV